MKHTHLKRLVLLAACISSIQAVHFASQGLHDFSNNVYAQTIEEKKEAKKERGFSLNFKDVEISEFLTIMSQVIGKNIVLDDKVRGKITISSAKQVPISQAYDIMKSILEVKGFAVVEAPNIIKIVPINEAMKKNIDVIIDGKETNISPENEKTITYLLKVKNSDAGEIANSLKELKSQMTQIVHYRSLNIIIFSGMANEISSLIKISKALDEVPAETVTEKISRTGNIHVIHLENANAEELANVLSRVPFSDTAQINTSPMISTQMAQSDKGKRITKTQVTPFGNAQKLSIVPNKETNSLIITAKSEDFTEIQRIIRELDVVREQVLIEALIVEVSAESGWGFGIDWMLGYKSGNNLFGGSSIMGTPPNYSLPSGIDSTKKLAIPLAKGFQLGYLSDTSVLGFALLNASMSDKNFKILSTPQILTIDNHEAELNVGEEIAVPTNTRVTDLGSTFQTFDYKAVGIKLKITPHITKKRRIVLDLYQEVNNIIGETTITSGGSVVPPKLGKRDIKTKVTVRDGKTIVVGGLIRNNKIEEVTKVPLLGDIPLLGWFFKRKTVSYVKSNLLVFITPHIMTRQDKIDVITKQKRDTQRIIKD